VDTWTPLNSPPNAKSFVTYPGFEDVVPSESPTDAEPPTAAGPQVALSTVTLAGTGPTGPQVSLFVAGTRPQVALSTVTLAGTGPTVTVRTLVELVPTSNEPVAEVRARIDADNAIERIRFMENVPCLRSEQLAEQLGQGAKKAFSVLWHGREEYPAFQFRDGCPLPVIAAVLKALPDKMTPWQIAFWFVSSNPWLDGKAPYTMLSDTDSIVQAARQEDEAIAG
jgi:hypothetical protein